MTASRRLGQTEASDRMNRTRKMLMMAEAEPSAPGGNGDAPAAAAPAPAAGDAPTGHDLDIAATIAAVKDDPAKRNALFAEMRKTGLLGPAPRTKTTPASAKPAAPAPEPTPQSDGPLTVADMEARMKAMLGRERAFNDAVLSMNAKLTPGQLTRLRSSFEHETPGDVAEFVNGWVEDMGIAAVPMAPATSTPAAHTAPSAPTAPQRPQGQPVTAVPGPPPARADLSEVNAWDMSDADRVAYVKQHGPRAYFEKVRLDGKDKKLLLPKG
jgi:hypothetical protein